MKRNIFNSVAVCFAAFVSGCACKLTTSGEYRFAMEVDRAPTAYSNTINAGENLEISLKIRNLSEQSLCIAPEKVVNQSEGIVARIKLIEAVDEIKGDTAVVRGGLRSGKTLQSEANSTRTPTFDPHHKAVVKLSESAPDLLGMKEEKILTSFDLFGNETMVHAIFPVDWSKVNWGLGTNKKFAVKKQLSLEVTLQYLKADGSWQLYSKPFRFHTDVNFVNGVRGKRAFIPVSDGPHTGTFE